MRKPMALLFVLLTSVLVLGCTRTVEEKSSLTIALPKIASSSSHTQKSVSTQSSSGSWNSTLNPTSLADINCYAVFVGGPEESMRNSYCSDSTTGAEKIRFGRHRIFIPSNSSEVSIDVPAGSNRTIYLVGLKAQNGACVNIGSNGPDRENMSYPHILSTKTVDLIPGRVVVNMTATLDTNNKFDNCTIMGAGGGSSSGTLMFGDGRDGDIETVSAAYVTLGQDGFDNSSIIANNSLSSTKKFSSARRVSFIDSDGKSLSLAQSFTSDDFQVGDEVLWVVMAASAGGGSADTACGPSDLPRGRWDFARITNIVGSGTIVLDKPISSNPAAINNTRLGEPDASASSEFCRIQVVRVPNFNTIKVNTSLPLTFDTIPFTMDSNGAGAGGIIAFRVKNLILNAHMMIQANGRGFQGMSAKQGIGLNGIGYNGSADNENGGGMEISSGGGGNAGAGGGSTQGAFGGKAITYCLDASNNPAPCSIFKRGKIILGGAGGGSSSSGAAGGGAIFVFVENISGSGSLFLESNGDNAYTSAGGGAGGTIHLSVKNVATGLTSIEAQANGSNAGDSGGGGGGGGSVEIQYCQNLGPAFTTQTNGGTGGYEDGESGLPLVSAESFLCTAQ